MGWPWWHFMPSIVESARRRSAVECRERCSRADLAARACGGGRPGRPRIERRLRWDLDVRIPGGRKQRRVSRLLPEVEAGQEVAELRRVLADIRPRVRATIG